MLKDTIIIVKQEPDGTLACWDVELYQCDNCSKEFDASIPHYADGDHHYCCECAFLKGLISEKVYLDYGSGFNSHMFRAYVENGEVKIKYGK